MCGIVALFAKNPLFQPRLGEHLSAMLTVMTDRGPDSAGFAIYGAGEAGRTKMTLRAPAEIGDLAAAMALALGIAIEAAPHDTHLLVTLPTAHAVAARRWLAAHRADIEVVGAGERIELYKEVGLPGDIARRFGLARMTGTHGVGHTRMATESAITTNGAHPFSTGADECLVHNGSLSNHNNVRRDLIRKGLRFQTANDSEVAAGFLTWRMREGDSLTRALESCLDTLDGFYTFVIGTRDGLAVLRDPISCKPAVMAETQDYVAFGSEYRAMAMLPGIAAARVWEPEPARAYVWEHAA